MADKEVAKILLKLKAVTLRVDPPYKWTSGILAPIYTDNRLLISYPQERDEIINYFLELLKKNRIEFDVVAGTATAGIPWAAWIAEKLKKPMVYARKEAKGHGKENLIEGKLEKNSKVLVVEDLISTGGSSISTINAVREADCEADFCVAIFTYKMKKADENFKENKCRLFTLTDFNALVEVASETGYIKKDEKNVVLSWSKDPEKWGR